MKIWGVRILSFLFFIAFLWTFGINPALGIDSPYADEIVQQADGISASIMSPYCPELLLRDCPSGKASDLKERIRQELSLGKSHEQVIKELNDQYGDLSASPSMSGFGQFAWTAPLLFLLGGVVFLIRWLSRPPSSEEIRDEETAVILSEATCPSKPWHSGKQPPTKRL